MFFFAGFPSAKDPSYNERCPGKSVACVITEVGGRVCLFFVCCVGGAPARTSPV
jgi:hypothetical protein